MKYITFVIPSYNSQDYLAKCVESLLPGGDDVEIIIVNDGSTDSTGAIADKYAAQYPSIVRAVHKPNGGYGSGVNAGIARATGKYFKVVDSDDWFDAAAYEKYLSTIKAHVNAGKGADVYVTNFVYEHVSDGTRYVSDYAKKFPRNKFFGWDDIKPMRLWKMLLMHSLTYRTQKLRESGLVMPEHTFYVDNYYAYYPLAYMQRLYYINIDLYRYYIGRSDQSVTIENMVKRYADQLRCMDAMLSAYSYSQLRAMCRPLRRLMYHTLNDILLNTYFFTTARDEPARRQGMEQMWQNLRSRDKKLYRKIRRMPAICFLNKLSWRMRGRVTGACYKFLCRHVKLGQI